MQNFKLSSFPMQLQIRYYNKTKYRIHSVFEQKKLATKEKNELYKTEQY